MVDLGRFELPTSSMPFKKYQSLADTSKENTRLSTKGFERPFYISGGGGAENH
jgi:hypothetical protein